MHGVYELCYSMHKKCHGQLVDLALYKYFYYYYTEKHLFQNMLINIFMYSTGNN